MRPLRLLTLVCAASMTSAHAHDLWLEKDAGGFVLYQGHRHSTHAGADIVPYDPAALKAARCLGAGGQVKPLAATPTHPVKFVGDCAAVVVLFSTGYWTKTPWETKNLPRTEVPGAIASWRAEEQLKRIDRWLPESARPLGQGLEITPTDNPFQVAVGDKLVVRVTDAGRPQAGVPVAYQGETRGATDANGTVAIRLRRGGMQLIAASSDTPLAIPQAERLIRSTTLQFELAP